MTQTTSQRHQAQPPAPKGTLLLISQVYVPDPASVGQHLADVASEMARRGYRVVVLTANRGYDDPTVKYPSKEVIDSVQIRRLPWSSLGKGSILVRLLAGVLFLTQATLRGLFVRNLTHLLVSTSPPLSPIAALVIRFFRRVPVTFWAMDLNPDQAVALGKVKPGSLGVRLLERLNRWILRHATSVIALDRYMAQRLNAKVPIQDKLLVMPPWPHEDHLGSVPHPDNPFRAKQGWQDKFVIMFSGNLSIASPVDTILEAALKLQDEPRLLFAFIGGGLGKQRVEEVIRQHQPRNIVSLPYQPLSQIKYSLSAADVHLVSMGGAIVGICHPCKVYGAMAVARPILFLGPDPCHISDLMTATGIGWHVRHGDVQGAIQTIRQILRTDPAQLQRMGQIAQQSIHQRLGKQLLCGQFCDALERGSQPPSPTTKADNPA